MYPRRTASRRDALIQNVRNGQYFVEIDLSDLQRFNAALHDAVLKHPNEYIPLVSRE